MLQVERSRNYSHGACQPEKCLLVTWILLADEFRCLAEERHSVAFQRQIVGFVGRRLRTYLDSLWQKALADFKVAAEESFSKSKRPDKKGRRTP